MARRTVSVQPVAHRRHSMVPKDLINQSSRTVSDGIGKDGASSDLDDDLLTDHRRRCNGWSADMGEHMRGCHRILSSGYRSHQLDERGSVMDLEHIAKIAPVGTALIALCALCIASYSLWVQRNIAQKRAAIDFFLKTEMDQTMLAAYQRYKVAVTELKSTPSLEEFEKTEHYGALRSYLDVHELIAVGIHRRVFDGLVCYNFWCFELSSACGDCRSMIESEQRKPGLAGRYVELVKLDEKWRKKMVKRQRRQKPY